MSDLREDMRKEILKLAQEVAAYETVIASLPSMCRELIDAMHKGKED